MASNFISSARVPYEMYVERAADKQIRRIITEMARPGYVLVARQMGKTNLLLHTKETLQDKQNIFVYIDFSTMSNYSETECVNALIDTAIEIQFELFTEAEERINALREGRNYNALKMFNRELRILLEYVNKIVFILDEIDALTRRDYSDKIFSLIRGHYYAATNFPDLKKATYILSGVIEPKDIIKDVNISPFNIGEKIYLSDFNYNEFIQLVNKSEYLNNLSEVFKKHLYSWTKGQPRMTWDLCRAIEDHKLNQLEDIDKLVKYMYLTSFDIAPIDSIRERVKSDSELRDALIQLSINKGNVLSDDVKSKLYLAGIIDYQNSIPQFKNPIMEKSLSYDWLLTIHNEELDFLSEANKSIYLAPDYQKAINHLKKFLDSKSIEQEKLFRAYYLLAEAYFRSYTPEESLSYLKKIDSSKIDLDFYFKVELLKAKNLEALNLWVDAETVIRHLLDNSISSKNGLYLKANIELASNLITQEGDHNLEEAESIILKLYKNDIENLLQNHLLSLAAYILALIYNMRAKLDESIQYIDSAIMAAQNKEKPSLLYMKLLLVEEENKSDIANELYISIQNLDRPPLEDFDNPINFNVLHAAQILSYLMLHFPQFNVIKQLRQFFYESKENAVLTIASTLLRQDSNDRQATDFLDFIEDLIDQKDWMFDLNHKIIIAQQQVQFNKKLSYANSLLRSLKEEKIEYPENIYGLFNTIFIYYREKKNYHELLKITHLYFEILKSSHNKYYLHTLYARYFEILSLYHIGSNQETVSKVTKLQNDLVSVKQSTIQYNTDFVNNDILVSIENNLKIILDNILKQTHPVNIANKNTSKQIGRNTKVIVKYFQSHHEIEGKYKTLEQDIKLGLCIIIRICD